MSDAPPIIYPWEGTGWPIEIFKEPNIEMIRKHYLCTRNECGNVLRDPMQLECGDRVCEGCYNILLQIPALQRICHACEGEIHNANTNTPMAAQIQRIDPFLEIQPKRITQTMAQTEELGHQGMELDATTSSQAVQSGKSELEKSAWIIPEKCNRDNAAAMEINKLDVKCPYRCDTERVGTRPLCIRTLKKHMRDCLLRLVACEYCTDRVRHCDLESHLSLGCPFRMVDCPNGCGKRGIQGKDLAKHLAECAKKPPVCRLCMNPFLGSHHFHLLQDCFASKCPLGCTDMRPGELTVSHLDDESKLVVHFVSLYDMIMAVKQAQETNQGGIAHGGMTPSQMTAILDRLLQLECRSERTERLLNEKVTKMTGRNVTGLLAHAGKAESNRKEQKDLKSLDKVLANDLHMLSSNDKTFRQRVESVKRQEASDSERFDNLEALSQSRQNEIDKQRETLTNYQLTSYGGRLIWRLDRVLSKKAESHIRLSHLSHPFYTETYGYKLCLKIFLNGDGDGRNSHISLYLVMLKGEFDAIISWPFQHNVTLKLRNQQKKASDIVLQMRPDINSTSCVRPKSEMNPAFGFPQFAPQDKVFDPQNGYVVDEAMFLEVIVSNSFETLHELPISVQESRGDR